MTNETQINPTLSIGDKVRSYDFEPFPNRDDCYVEGTITGIDDSRHMYEIRVEHDSMCPVGVRTEICSPISMHWGDWEGRITVL